MQIKEKIKVQAGKVKKVKEKERANEALCLYVLLRPPLRQGIPSADGDPAAVQLLARVGAKIGTPLKSFEI